MDYGIIINKNRMIKDDELPKNMISVGINEHPSISFENETNEILLEEQAAIHFKEMINDFNSCHKNKIIPDSGYRSIERQQRLLEYYCERDGENAYSYVALPRTSEHHTGLAIDVSLIKDGKYMDDITGDEPEMIELTNMCYKYGFILRYPKGKDEITGYIYEPWHFRYVGLELAKEIHDTGLTLEEIKASKYQNILENDEYNSQRNV